ncbi:MAG TPA: O-antigen ligase family protein [Casimicrobiaceae bacterium]|nr:O-antigen ligase family protein [Casimicrobiaceae bacterium]
MREATFRRLRLFLVTAACAYLALLPTGALSSWRSIAFASSAAAAIAVAVLGHRERASVPSIGIAIPAAVAAWATWSIASLLWSVDFAFSAREIRGDVLWGLAAIVIFYVAASTSEAAFRALAATSIAALAFWVALAIGFAIAGGGLDLRPFHRGEGAFTTYLVTLSPFLALLCWRPPAGFATHPRTFGVAIFIGVLVVIAARLSSNRVVWLAFATAVIVIALAMRTQIPAARRLAVALAVIAVCALSFTHAARDRAVALRGEGGDVAPTLATDPRLAIWKHSIDRIGDRPWLGHGYGSHIVGAAIGSDTGDPRVLHAHNLFASQWLQTGVVGLVLFLGMVGAVAAAYLRFVRSGDPTLVALGAVGLAVIAGYLVRNLTDDFFLRANGKLLFAANAVLLGYGALRLKRASGGAERATATAR